MKNVNVEINLRTRGLGIGYDADHLYVTAIRNKLNQVEFVGHDQLDEFESQDDEVVIEFLDQFKNNQKIQRADAYLVLSRDEVQVQIADFPNEAKDNLDEAVSYQLESLFPVNLEEWDFFPQVIGRGEQLKVMIVAVRKERLGHVFGFIRRFKLKISGVSLDTFALVNGLAKSRPEQFEAERIAVCRRLKGGLELILINQGRLAGSHFAPLEGDDFSSLIPELEQGLSNARMDPDEIDTYLWQGTSDDGLRAFLSEEIGMPFSSWRDAVDQEVPEPALSGFGAGVVSVNDKFPLDLNMLPHKLRKRQKRLPVILAAIVAILLLLFVVVGEARSYSSLYAQNKRLDGEYTELLTQMNAIADVRAQYQERTEELERFKRYRANNVVIKVLETLTREVPDHTYLTNFQIKGHTNLIVQGESEDPFEIQRILSDIPYLKDVKPGNAITQGRNRDGKRRFMYKAVIDLEAL